MDLIGLMACLAAGVIALIFAAKNPAAGLLTHAFAWVGGGYLSAVFIWTGTRTHTLSPFEWTGEAYTGPITLFILVLAMASPFIVGWDIHGKRSHE
jgi:hypothetical protein